MENKKNRKINIISNRNIESRKTTAKLKELLSQRGFQASEKYDEDAELNICVGGDGSFLKAVHRYKFPKIPFIGINTGNLGFFQEIKTFEIQEFINKYIDGKYTIEEIFLLKTKVCTKEKCYYLKSINEIVVKTIKSKVIHLDLFIDENHLETFSGDALIISTPVGSTAYNYSSHGSIIYPTLKTMQITPLSPINSKAYRSLPNSVVVPGDIKVKIKPRNTYRNSTLVVNDGVEFRYKNIDYIECLMSNKKIYKLNFDKDMYWNNLKDKFL